MLLNKLLAL